MRMPASNLPTWASARVPATRKVLRRAGLKVANMDVIESNKTFAAQAWAMIRELDHDPAK